MKKGELVFVPSPGMGHLLSIVQLAKLILRRCHHRLSAVVLIINHPIDSSMVNAYVDSQSRDPTHITFITLPLPPNPPGPTSSNFFTTLAELHKPFVKQTVESRASSGSPRPVGFILDMFCTTMIDIANELNIPSYIFFTSGANLLTLMFHTQSLRDNEAVDIVAELGNPATELDVPGFRNRVPSKVLPAVMVDGKVGGSVRFLNQAKRYREAKGILVNTFMELELYAMQSMLDYREDREIPAVYPVGPILELGERSRGGAQEREDEKSIMRWLDEQPEESVVFLCFGSMGCFEEEQVKEIANGLDRSGYRFLWSLRRPPPEGRSGLPSKDETFLDALPEGFMGRTAQRGRIIAWAPQAAILAHWAIGVFVSHCGWNSMLESLWFGVPVATWPMYAEQQLNAFQLVKELGLGVEIRMDYHRDWRWRKGSFVVTAEEIENGVRKVMSMDEEMKGRVREMRERSRKALQDGGSSNCWLGRFIEDVLDNVTPIMD